MASLRITSRCLKTWGIISETGGNSLENVVTADPNQYHHNENKEMRSNQNVAYSFDSMEAEQSFGLIDYVGIVIQVIQVHSGCHQLDDNQLSVFSRRLLLQHWPVLNK